MKTTRKPKKTTGTELSDDGSIDVTIKGGENDGKKISVDVMAYQIAIAPVEAKHNVTRKGWTSTAEFLNDLASATANHLNLPTCSGFFAYHLWHMVARKYLELKKNFEG